MRPVKTLKNLHEEKNINREKVHALLKVTFAYSQQEVFDIV